jgi:hypothetical protein
MNKTQRRAIQKHRAKAAKFEVRRKVSGGQVEAKAKPGLTVTSSATRAKTTGRRAAGAEPAE